MKSIASWVFLGAATAAAAMIVVRCAAGQETETEKGPHARNEITGELLIWDGTAWVSPLGETEIGRFELHLSASGVGGWMLDTASGSIRFCALNVEARPAVGPLCTAWVPADTVSLSSIGTALIPPPKP